MCTSCMGIRGKEHKVQLLILALTGACNLRCAYCYASNQVLETMPLSILEASVSYLDTSSKATLQLTGGEPFLAWDRVVYAVERVRHEHDHIQIQIQTNGTLLDEEKVLFLKHHRVALGISLDGGRIVHDRIRPFQDGRGSAIEILKGLQRLAQQDIPVGITTVISADNVDHLHEIIDLAYYLGNVKQIGFNVLRPQGRGAGVAPLSEGALVQGIEKMLASYQRWSQATGQTVRLAPLEKIYKLRQGYAPFSHCYALHQAGLYVDPRGDLYSCASLSGQLAYRLGHVTEGLERAQQDTMQGVLEPVVDVCNRCEYLQECGGACYSRSYEAGQINPLECAFKRTCIQWYRHNCIHTSQ